MQKKGGNIVRIENPALTLMEMNNSDVLAKVGSTYMVSGKFLKKWNENFGRLQKIKPKITLQQSLIPTFEEFNNDLTDKKRIEWYMVFMKIQEKGRKK